MTPQELQAIKDRWKPYLDKKAPSGSLGGDFLIVLAEIERLTSCLSFEQNYLSRVGTHADGCYKWGPGHWDCAVQEIERLQEENEGLKIPKQHSCNNCKNNYRSVDDKDCAYCINSFALPNWEGLK